LEMAHKSIIDDTIDSLQGLARSLRVASSAWRVSEDLVAALGRLVEDVARIESMLEEQEPMEEEPKSMFVDCTFLR
jgi:hypothetical protein